jgi:hypothetical protein
MRKKLLLTAAGMPRRKTHVGHSDWRIAGDVLIGNARPLSASQHLSWIYFPQLNGLTAAKELLMRQKKYYDTTETISASTNDPRQIQNNCVPIHKHMDQP